MNKKTFVFALSMVLLAGCATGSYMSGADGIGDRYYPLLGNGGYDALHYTLELFIDPVNNTVSGDCIMQAQATQPLKTFNLDFSGLDINKAGKISSGGRRTDNHPLKANRQRECFHSHYFL